MKSIFFTAGLAFVLSSGLASADDFTSRVQQHDAEVEAAREQHDYEQAVLKINRNNETFVAKVFSFARHKKADPGHLHCYDYSSTIYFHGSGDLDRDTTDVTWTSHKGLEVPVGVPRGGSPVLGFIGTAVMMPLLLPAYIHSEIQAGQARVYPPQMADCHFDLGRLACALYAAEVQCVDTDGSTVYQQKF